MIASLDRISDWLAPPASARSLAWVRIAVMGFACIWLAVIGPDLLARSQLDPARFSPVGLAILTGALTPTAVILSLVAVMGLGLAAVSGRGYRVVAPAFALGLYGLLSYRNSWGHMSHVEHLLMLHVLVLGLAPAGDALRLGSGAEPTPAHARYGWPLRLLMLLTVSTYAIAGLAKLRVGGMEWLTGDTLRLHVAHEGLRSQLVGAPAASLGGMLLPHAWVFQAMALGTVVLEIGAPLALLAGRVRTIWIAGLWAMHLGIWIVMGIGFPYPLSGVAFIAFAWLRGRPAR